MSAGNYDPQNQAPQAGYPPPAGQQYPPAPPAGQQYPPAPPAGYGQPYQGAPAQSKAMAIASLVLGIVSLFLFGIIAGPLAIIFGALRVKPGSAGRGMAIAGIVLGALGTIGAIVLLAIVGHMYA